jgi:hypothetical protein
MPDRRQQPSLIVVHQTPSSLDLSRASERPFIATLSPQTRVLLQVAIPTNQFLKQEAWLSEMLSRSCSYHLSRRSGVPGFDVLAQPLSARQKLDSFLLHHVFGTTHVGSAICNKSLPRAKNSRCWVDINVIYQLDGRDSSLVSQFGTRLASREMGAGQLNASKAVEAAV